MAIFRGRRPAARLSRPRPTGDSLRASGERVTEKRAQDIARLNSTWQRRAFAYYDALGEIKYAAQFFARLGKLELFVGEWVTGADGERELDIEKAQGEPEAVRALDRIRDPGGSGSRTGILSSYGRIKFLAGEGYLFYTRTEDGEETWEFLSTSEIRPNPLGGQGNRAAYQRIKAPALSPEMFREPAEDDWENIDAKEAIAYRFWRRHPQYSQWPDGPMRGVLDLCEELLILDRSSRSQSLSRMAGNGILFLDDRLSGIGETPPLPTPGEDPAEDPWLNDLTAAMVEPMSDEGAAEHVVPLLARVTVPIEPGLKLEDMVYHLRLTDPALLAWATEERMSLINRIAIGLEMPPEVLIGMSKANHWTAWEVSDDAWQHLEPYAQEFCDDLTTGYLIPTLRAANVQYPERFAVGFDPARLRTEPAKAKDAKDLHKAGALSDDALRDATGFQASDAPSDEERRIWLSVYSRDPGFALGEETAVDRAAEEAEEQPEGEVEVPEQEETTTGRPGGTPGTTEKGPPPNEGESLTGSVVESQVLAACQVGLMRARQIAGNRIASRAKRDRGAAALLAAAPPGVFAAVTLGKDAVHALVGTEIEAVQGCREILGAPLLLWGLTAAQVDLLVTAVEQHAAMTLYEKTPRPFPPQLRTYIRGVVRGTATANAATNGALTHA